MVGFLSELPCDYDTDIFGTFRSQVITVSQYLLAISLIFQSNGATFTILLSWDASLHKAASGDIWCHPISPAESISIRVHINKISLKIAYFGTMDLVYM